MANISTIRHASIVNPNEYGELPITIIGCGATGSHLAMSLIELGFEHITFYDFDKVEEHNLANQAYEQQDIGKQKVDALFRLIEAKLGTVPETMHFKNERVEDQTLHGIVFMLTDTMASRYEIYDNCIKDSDVTYVIETRMASSYGNIYGFYPATPTADNWHATLTSDEETEVSACGSAITVGPTAKITANLAVWHLINRLTDEKAVDPQVNFYLKPLTVGSGAIA